MEKETVEHNFVDFKCDNGVLTKDIIKEIISESEFLQGF